VQQSLSKTHYDECESCCCSGCDCLVIVLYVAILTILPCRWCLQTQTLCWELYGNPLAGSHPQAAWAAGGATARVKDSGPVYRTPVVEETHGSLDQCVSLLQLVQGVVALPTHLCRCNSHIQLWHSETRSSLGLKYLYSSGNMKLTKQLAWYQTSHPAWKAAQPQKLLHLCHKYHN